MNTPFGLADQLIEAVADIFDGGGGTGSFDVGGSGASGGGGSGGGGTTGGLGNYYPLVLDLSGGGIKITPLSSSNMFFDMSNDGFAQRTAWANGWRGRAGLRSIRRAHHPGEPIRVHAVGPLRDQRPAGARGRVRHQSRRRAQCERRLVERFPHSRHQRQRHDHARDPGAGGRHLDQSGRQYGQPDAAGRQRDRTPRRHSRAAMGPPGRRRPSPSPPTAETMSSSRA